MKRTPKPHKNAKARRAYAATQPVLIDAVTYQPYKLGRDYRIDHRRKVIVRVKSGKIQPGTQVKILYTMSRDSFWRHP